MKSFTQLKSNLKKDTNSLNTINVALLADSATQLLSIALKGTSIDRSHNLESPDLGYNQIDNQLINPNSELYKSLPEFVILFYSYNNLSTLFYNLDTNKKDSFADDFIQKIQENHKLIDSRLSTNIIFFNIPEINDSIYGSYSSQIKSSFSYQLKLINTGISKISEETPNFYIFDFNNIVLRYGMEKVFNPKLIYSSDITLSIDILPIVSSSLLDIITATKGKSKKCIILDLDNTLWGGIIGDDGIENIEIGNVGRGKVFSYFQLWLKQLKNRGILLAICSKNEESTILNALESHPEMILRLEDFAIIKANWNNKVENIIVIRNELNISFDSMVFIDDNPVERAMVNDHIEDITIPEMPEDCAYFVDYLQSLNLFETVSTSENDLNRTNQYREQTQRNSDRQNFYNEDDFMKSLDMESSVHNNEEDNKFLIPRLAQLSQRSNQFNLRTTRYTEKDIIDLREDKNKGYLGFELDDRFGKYGLVSFLSLIRVNNNELFIENWVMSCRVLNRGLEAFILNKLVSYAKEQDIETISGEYLPTSKNMPVEDLFKSLGFKKANNKWYINTQEYNNKPVFISEKREF